MQIEQFLFHDFTYAHTVVTDAGLTDFYKSPEGPAIKVNLELQSDTYGVDGVFVLDADGQNIALIDADGNPIETDAAEGLIWAKLEDHALRMAEYSYGRPIGDEADRPVGQAYQHVPAEIGELLEEFAGP